MTNLDMSKHEEVKVTYVNTTDTVHFPVALSTTLNAMFDIAYDKLKETRRAGDKYFCKGGTDLGGYLALTLHELEKRKICLDRHFEIAGETGGAAASAGAF